MEGYCQKKEVIAGTLMVQSTEPIKEGEDLAEQAYIKFISTPKARKIEETESTSGMMIKAGAPVFGYDGKPVGILDQPFTYMTRKILIIFFVIVAVATALAASPEMIPTKKISPPLERMLEVTKELSEGDLGYELDTETGTIELDTLAAYFNKMSAQLRAREESLKTINEKLTALNKTYLDLVDFVSHELKGVVATTNKHRGIA